LYDEGAETAEAVPAARGAPEGSDVAEAAGSSAALARSILEARPPATGFSLWFLGQNSFVLKGPDGFTVAVDPYLSDWCARRGKAGGPTPRSRKYPPDIAAADLSVDLVLLTHSHCDHADPETLAVLAKNPRIRVAGSRAAVKVALEAGFPMERVRTLLAGEEASFGRYAGVLEAAKRIRAGNTNAGITVRVSFALPTDGTDLNHLGFLIRCSSGATFWDTGDTAWCELLPVLAGAEVRAACASWRDVPDGASDDSAAGMAAGMAAGPDLMAVCINGGYANLSQWEAAKLAGSAGARYVIPAHWDLFPHNSLDPEPFRTSLEKNSPGSIYARLDRPARYDFDGKELRKAN